MEEIKNLEEAVEKLIQTAIHAGEVKYQITNIEKYLDRSILKQLLDGNPWAYKGAEEVCAQKNNELWDLKSKILAYKDEIYKRAK